MEDKLLDFLRVRREAAAETAKKSKEKGGYALLSYYHFRAKDAPYKNAIGVLKEQGISVLKKTINAEYSKYIHDLKITGMTQKEFQDIVGKIEVLGEIIIFIREND